MKKLILLLPLIISGCSTAPKLTPALVTIAVQTGTALGLNKHPEATPYVRAATPILCSAAQGTNLEPAKIVALIEASGAVNPTNIEAVIILNSAIGFYGVIFDSFGTDWQSKQPELTRYLQAVCAGLQQGLPPQGTALRTRKLPAHLR